MTSGYPLNQIPPNHLQKRKRSQQPQQQPQPPMQVQTPRGIEKEKEKEKEKGLQRKQQQQPMQDVTLEEEKNKESQRTTRAKPVTKPIETTHQPPTNNQTPTTQSTPASQKSMNSIRSALRSFQTLLPTQSPKQPPTQPSTPQKRRKSSSRKNSCSSESDGHTMREYELQTRVKAVDGQTVMRDEENFYKQSRVFVKDGQEAQIAWVDDHQCCMWLSDWGVSQTVDELECARCEKTLRRVKPASLACWGCGVCNFDICFSCLPVVIKTPPPIQTNE